MSKSLLFETKSVLKELDNLRKTAAALYNSFSGYAPLILVDSHRKGSSKSHYYLKERGQQGKRYLGENSRSTVENIKTAKYLKQLIRVIDKDMQLLEAVCLDYVIPEHESINKMLPKVYRAEVPPVFIPVSPEAQEWKNRMEKEKARHRAYRPEDLKYTAKDGTPMRSLSEVIIANYLLSLGICFVYELPLTHHGKTVLPDFTILSPIDNKTVIIIEHQGAMDSVTYQEKFIKTVLFYLKTKMVPNKDVFFTFNHLDKNLDIGQIDSILRIAFGFEPDGSGEKRQLC